MLAVASCKRDVNAFMQELVGKFVIHGESVASVPFARPIVNVLADEHQVFVWVCSAMLLSHFLRWEHMKLESRNNSRKNELHNIYYWKRRLAIVSKQLMHFCS